MVVPKPATTAAVGLTLSANTVSSSQPRPVTAMAAAPASSAATPAPAASTTHTEVPVRLHVHATPMSVSPCLPSRSSVPSSVLLHPRPLLRHLLAQTPCRMRGLGLTL